MSQPDLKEIRLTAIQEIATGPEYSKNLNYEEALGRCSISFPAMAIRFRQLFS